MKLSHIVAITAACAFTVTLACSGTGSRTNPRQPQLSSNTLDDLHKAGTARVSHSSTAMAFACSATPASCHSEAGAFSRRMSQNLVADLGAHRRNLAVQCDRKAGHWVCSAWSDPDERRFAVSVY